MSKSSVLIICTHNSARSQMAEGLLRHRYGDQYEVASAGTRPGGVHPLAIEVMHEIGIDLDEARSESIEKYTEKPFDYVVTVCNSAREECPYVPARQKNMHQSFEDPSAATGSGAEKLAAFRRVRDQISAWIEDTFAPAKQETE